MRESRAPQDKTLAEDVEGLDLEDVAHHWAASRPAIAGGILGVVISDVELANI